MKLKNSFSYLSGIPGVTENDVFELVTESQVLMLNRYEIFFRDCKLLQAYQIPLCNILDVTQVGRQETVLRDNSVIGSGLGGAFLDASERRTLRALKALKTEEVIRRMFFVITYLNENTPEDPRKIIFECSGKIADYRFSIKNDRMCSALQRVVNNTQPSPMVRRFREKARQLSVPNPGGVVTL